MNESEERQRGYDLEMAVLAANIRRDNAESQCARLGDAIARVLAAHREQYPLVTGGLAPCVTCHTPYPCAVAEALEPVRRILALPVCQDCGMRHEPGDKSSCIEGHGDDPVHGVSCPIAQTSDPMSCTCDDEPVPFRGQIGTGF